MGRLFKGLFAAILAIGAVGTASAQLATTTGGRAPAPPGSSTGSGTVGATGGIGLPVLTSGNVYYMSPTGDNRNPGTITQPFATLDVALQKVGGGNTIVLLPGVYPALLVPDYGSGTQQQPTIVMSQYKWQARIIGSPRNQGIRVGSTNVQWVIIDGFDVMGASYDGIKINGDHNTVRNCWSHNNRCMGMSAHGFTGTVFERNLIEYNGQHPSLDHGIYADGDQLVVRNNVVRHNANAGIQLWPRLTNSRVYNNVVIDNTDGIYIGGVDNGGANIIANNTITGHVVGLKMYSGNSDIVVNNIIVARRGITDNYSTIDLFRPTIVINSDYNLCVPPCPLQGVHGISVDPQFATIMGWLKAGSPAIGAGTWQNAPLTDFFGQPRPAGGPPTLGVFSYSAYLASPLATASWYNGEPYCYDPEQPTKTVPDFWILPPY